MLNTHYVITNLNSLELSDSQDILLKDTSFLP